MNSNLRRLRDLLDDNNVGFCYSDLIEEIDEDMQLLEDELSSLEDSKKDYDCTFCSRFDDRQDLHRDLTMLEAKHELKQISDEAYLVTKNILNQYVTI